MASSRNNVQSELKEACKLYKNFTNFIMEKGYRSLIKGGHITNAADCLESVINVMEIMEEIVDGDAAENSLNGTLGLRRMFSTPKINESFDGTLGLNNFFEPEEDDSFNSSHYTTAFNSSIFNKTNDMTALYTSTLEDLNEDFSLDKTLGLRRMFHEDKNKSLVGDYDLKHLFSAPEKNQTLNDSLGLRELFKPHKREVDDDKILQDIENEYLHFLQHEYKNENRAKPSGKSQIPKLTMEIKPTNTRQPLTWDDLNTDDEFDEDDYDPLDYPEWTRDKPKLKELIRKQEALNSDFASFFPQKQDPSLVQMFPQMTPSRRRRILKRRDSRWDVPATKPPWKI